MSTDDVFLNLKNKVPKESQNGLKERLGKADETAILRLQTLKLKNPTICLMVSIFLGGLGGDRFYIGDKILFAVKCTIGILLALFGVSGERDGGTLHMVAGLSNLAFVLFVLLDMSLCYKKCKKINIQSINESLKNI
ncbi:NINE protein [Campylobacter rectus]